MSRLSQFCCPPHWHKSEVGGFLPEMQGTYDPYVGWMCIMTEPFSSETDFTCLWLCSSHNPSANNKTFPIIWNDDIIHAIGPEPTSALLQNRQLFLVKHYHILHTDHSLHQLSFSMARPLGSSNIGSNKATEQTHPSVHLAEGLKWCICGLLTCHLISLLWFEQTWLTQNEVGSSRAQRTRKDKLFWGAELSSSAAKWNGSRKARESAKAAGKWHKAEFQLLQMERLAEDAHTEKAWKKQIGI